MSRVCYDLEGGWIERLITVTVEGRIVTGTAKAGWGHIDVTITSPIAGFTRSQNRRSVSFAWYAGHYPEARFAFQGALTEKGQHEAEQMLEAIYRDYLAVKQHEAAVDAECRRTRQALADLVQGLPSEKQPLWEERSALRRAFKAGRLPQQQYQRQRKALRGRLYEVDLSQAWAGEAAMLLSPAGCNASADERFRSPTQRPCSTT